MDDQKETLAFHEFFRVHTIGREKKFREMSLVQPINNSLSLY